MPFRRLPLPVFPVPFALCGLSLRLGNKERARYAECTERCDECHAPEVAASRREWGEYGEEAGTHVAQREYDGDHFVLEEGVAAVEGACRGARVGEPEEEQAHRVEQGDAHDGQGKYPQERSSSHQGERTDHRGFEAEGFDEHADHEVAADLRKRNDECVQVETAVEPIQVEEEQVVVEGDHGPAQHEYEQVQVVVVLHHLPQEPPELRLLARLLLLLQLAIRMLLVESAQVHIVRFAVEPGDHVKGVLAVQELVH